MKFLLARKEKMTQIFTDDGRAIAGTILSTGPLAVTQVKTKDGKDGYNAIQVGFGERRTKNISKPVVGHLKGKGFAEVLEFRTDEIGDLAVGSEITVDAFAPGDEVQVSGATKGRGFAGVVKRHGFHGGPRSHGQKHTERSPGSIGGSGGRAGGRVAKGIRMAGRMGGNRVTIQSLKILVVDAANNKLIVSGAVPGARGALLEIVSQ
jgi:large subunit ribosomal protein L3